MPNCQIIKTHGSIGIKIPDHFRQAHEYLLQKCYEKHAGFISVTEGPPRKPRSTGKYSQNHHFWGHCYQIAKDTGNSKDMVSYIVRKRSLNRGYPPKTGESGEPVIDLLSDGWLPQSESVCSSEEINILISEVHMLAAELNIILQEE